MEDFCKFGSGGNKGTVVISVDIERDVGLAAVYPSAHKKHTVYARHFYEEDPLGEMFEIFDSRRIPMTLAIVSKAMDDKLERVMDRAARSDVPHEIACHSFRHRQISDYKDQEDFRADLKRVRQFEKQMNIAPSVSYIFPCNKHGYLDTLHEEGWKICRLQEEGKDAVRGFGYIKRKAGTLTSYLLCRSPNVNELETTEQGLTITNGDMCYIDAQGLAGLLPTFCQTTRAIKGVEKAAVKRRIFHLWFHDFLFLRKKGALRQSLEKIADHIDKARIDGRIEPRTMRQLAAL